MHVRSHVYVSTEICYEAGKGIEGGVIRSGAEAGRIHCIDFDGAGARIAVK